MADDELRAKLASEVHAIGAAELVPHHRRDALVVLDPAVDLLDTAVAMGTNDHVTIAELIASGQLAKPSLAQLADWCVDTSLQFQFVIVQPYVLAQLLPRGATLFHITSEQQWRDAKSLGVYRPVSFDDEGFVHCSMREQVVSVANRFYAGRDDLVLLVIDEARLAADVIRENLEGGEELFPHVYGVIELSAVVKVFPFKPGQTGTFELPAEYAAERN